MKLRQLIEHLFITELDRNNTYDKNTRESPAAQEAHKLGLEYYSFGRWGKNGQVTHTTENGKLTPANPKAFPRPSVHPNVPSETRVHAKSGGQLLNNKIKSLEKDIEYMKDDLERAKERQYSTTAKMKIRTQLDYKEALKDALLWHQWHEQHPEGKSAPPDKPTAPVDDPEANRTYEREPNEDDYRHFGPDQ